MIDIKLKSNKKVWKNTSIKVLEKIDLIDNLILINDDLI